MNPDAVLESFGRLRRGQLKHYVIAGLPSLLSTVQVMSVVFTLGIPDHSCDIGQPQSVMANDNDTDIYRTDMTVASSNTDTTTERKAFQCSYSESVTTWYGNVSTSNTSNIGCNRWTYDKSVFENNVVSEMDLVCDRKLLRTQALVLYQLGYMPGILLSGHLSDRFGRKTALYICANLLLLFSIVQCFSPNYSVFLIIRILSGCCDGNFEIFFIWSLEMVAIRHRAPFGVCTNLFWALGLLILAFLAFFIRNWRHLQMAITFPFIPFLAYYWIMIESPRWLLTRGRTAEAEAVFQKLAEPKHLDFTELENQITKEKQVTVGRLWHVFTNWTLCVRAIVVYINWMVVAMLFYGLSLNVGNIGGDIYLNFFLSSVIEIFGYTVTVSLLKKCGRKPYFCAVMMLGGFACIGTAFPVMYAKERLYWLTLTLSLIGKFGASAAFAVIYLLTTELFPTVIRNATLGSSSMFARAGALIAPLVVELANIIEGDFAKALPLLTFGMSTVVAGLLVFVLPETSKIRLPDSLDDAKRLGRNANTDTPTTSKGAIDTTDSVEQSSKKKDTTC